MTQQLAAMLGTLAVQDVDVDSHPPATYLITCNYNRGVLALLVWGSLCLQGPELSGEETHGYICRQYVLGTTSCTVLA
jgi:hypothetical protein